jgi:hypothetical protein
VVRRFFSGVHLQLGPSLASLRRTQKKRNVWNTRQLSRSLMQFHELSEGYRRYFQCNGQKRDLMPKSYSLASTCDQLFMIQRSVAVPRESRRSPNQLGVANNLQRRQIAQRSPVFNEWIHGWSLATDMQELAYRLLGAVFLLRHHRSSSR